MLKQHQLAIKDFDMAIRIRADYAGAYSGRGFAYNYLKQYQSAIKDFDEAIRLKPDYAVSYNGRGYAYIFSGKIEEGCQSLKKACELGVCMGYEQEKRIGRCK